MAEPVVYVSTWKIKDGKFDEYRSFYAKQLKIIDEAEPQRRIGGRTGSSRCCVYSADARSLR